jgi:hypothetical protein
MKKSIKCFLIAISGLIFFTLSSSLFAYRSKKDSFNRPQFGGWFGVAAPLGNMSKKVESNLTGGGFIRINTPERWLKFGVESSYQKFKSTGTTEIELVPVYGNLLYQLPIDFAVRFQIKAGAGASYIKIQPENMKNWEPMFMAGFEVSFPAGKIFNIGLRLDYIHIYEGYAKKNYKGGHFFNAGIQLYFNL